jgi:hypothetical protein
MRWFGLGKLGKSTSTILTFGPGKINASFILEIDLNVCVERLKMS